MRGLVKALIAAEAGSLPSPRAVLHPPTRTKSFTEQAIVSQALNILSAPNSTAHRT